MNKNIWVSPFCVAPLRYSANYTNHSISRHSGPAANGPIVSPGVEPAPYEILLTPPSLPQTAQQTPTISSTNAPQKTSRTLAHRDHNVKNGLYTASTCGMRKRGKNLLPPTPGGESSVFRWQVSSDIGQYSNLPPARLSSAALRAGCGVKRENGFVAGSFNKCGYFDDVELNGNVDDRSTDSSCERAVSNAATAPRRLVGTCGLTATGERLAEIPRQSLKYVDRLGNGRYGEVGHLCNIPLRIVL